MASDYGDRCCRCIDPLRRQHCTEDGDGHRHDRPAIHPARPKRCRHHRGHSRRQRDRQLREDRDDRGAYVIRVARCAVSWNLYGDTHLHRPTRRGHRHASGARHRVGRRWSRQWRSRGRRRRHHAARHRLAERHPGRHSATRRLGRHQLHRERQRGPQVFHPAPQWSGHAQGLDRRAVRLVRVTHAPDAHLFHGCPGHAVGGNVVTTAATPLAVVDTRFPIALGTLVNTRSGAGSGFAPDDTFRLTITGQDNARLQRVGYRFGPPASIADSFATTDSALTQTITRAIPASWIGSSTYAVFAVDAVGNRREVLLGTLTVANRARQAPWNAALGGTVRDMAFDTKRNTLYLSIPDSNRVAV